MRGAFRLLTLLLVLAAAPAQAEDPAGTTARLESLNAVTAAALAAGDPAGALNAARTALAFARARQDAAPEPFALALNNLGFLLAEVAGAPTEARPLLREAIGLAETGGRTGGEAWVRAMANLARIEAGSGALEPAVERLERMVAGSRGGDWHGAALATASAMLSDMERFSEAMALFEELLAVAPGLVAPHFSEALESLRAAQDRAEAEARHDDALALIRGRIALVQGFVPDAGRELVRQLHYQTFTQTYVAGRYGAAAEALRAWADSGPMTGEERAHLAEMADLSLQVADLSGYGDRREVGLGYAELALAYNELAFGAGDPRLGPALRTLAHAQTGIGRLDLAALSLQRAASVLSGAAGHPGELYLVHEDLASNAWLRGDLELAAAFAARADSTRRAATGPGDAGLGDMDRAILATNRARLLRDIGRPGEARATLDDAWRHYRAAGRGGALKWNDRAQAAQIHATAAQLADALGDAVAALSEMRAAVAVARDAMPSGHPELALLLANAADHMLATGHGAEGRALLEEAVAIYERSLPEGVPQSVQARSTLALLHVAEGRRDRALPLLRRIARARQNPAYGASLPEAAGDFELLAWALVDTPQPSHARLAEAFEALQWTHVTRSAEAISMMEERLAAANPERAVWLRRRHDLREAHARNLSALLAAHAAGTSAQVAALDARHAAIEADLAEVTNALQALGLETAGIGTVRPMALAEVQRSLAPDEALVTFLLPGLRPERVSGLAQSSNHAIAVTREAVHVARIPEARRGALNARVRAFRCEVAISDPGCGPQSGVAALRGAMSLEAAPGPRPGLRFDAAEAQALYRDLFGGLEEVLAGKAHLLIVPPPDLLRLPFQALLTGPVAGDGLGAAPWLIRRHAISVLPSVPSLRVLRARQPGRTPPDGPERFLGFGDPVIGQAGPIDCGNMGRSGLRAAPPENLSLLAPAAGPASGIGTLARPDMLRQLPRLPDAACELAAIGAVFGAAASEIHTGAAATETRVKQLAAAGRLSTFDVLVFATHGLTAGETGARAPGLVLTPPETASAEDDGLLSAAEIATLQFDARLAVLSACNTAAGEAEESEGLSGLARAFFHAGVRALLVTHWSVFSSAAVEVSTGLFAARSGRPDLRTAEALREAVLTILDEPRAASSHMAGLRHHPSYWAAFAIVGAS